MHEHHLKIQHADFTVELVLGGHWSPYERAELRAASFPIFTLRL